ncbi:MerR family transcriptional regulator [Paenibacillus sp. BC26]|uniref:MerR family transcriptional regulator n=1 Tax=Paenibacillus sp. BC26 TaxID=1881032 RepID=UPI0008E86655|nr:MerR family transcriptional regulator [Paenibacillus sp. BC26]SFS53894.1 MerR family transcriptional regulator, redox-sensitive transcriptional activator SoxR [Paenibacillus sp. BC26]
MDELTIGQLAAKANVAASTLRYYESIGLLPSPERKNGQRRYDPCLLERINFIKVAQQTGFHIQEIAILLEGYEADRPISDQWEQLAKNKRSELENRKNHVDSMIQILDNCISSKSLNWTECLEQIQKTGKCC